MRGDGSGNTLTNNVLQTLAGDRLRGQFATEDYNLIGGGPRFGAHDRACCANFVNRAANDYRLRAGSLPFTAGYQPAGVPVPKPQTGGPAGGAAKKLNLRLRVKPRRVRVGTKRRFRFRLVYRSGSTVTPVPAARPVWHQEARDRP